MTDPFAPKSHREEVDTFLMGGGGAPLLKFPTIGTKYTGIVIAKSVEQQRDYDDPDMLLWWSEGKRVKNATQPTPETKPVLHAIVTLQTDAIGTFDKFGNFLEIDDDDSVRRWFVKGQAQKALREAIQKSGGPTLELFSKVTVTYTGDGKQDNPRYNPPKLVTAEYIRPENVAKNDPLLLKVLSQGDNMDDDPFAS